MEQSIPHTTRFHANLSYETVRVVYKWEVENFTTNPPSTNGFAYFDTEHFSPHGRDDIRFQLRLYPSRGERYPSVVVEFFSESPLGIKCKTSSWLLKKNDDKFKVTNLDFSLEDSSIIQVFNEHLSVIKNENNNLLPNDILTFVCEITLMFEKFTEKVISSSTIKMQDEKNVIIENQGKLLQSGKFADFEFTIGQRKFPVHKAILHSRSPYFEALFSRDFKEKTTNSMPIEDIDADMFAEILDYIYTSNVPKFTDEAKTTELMIIADRFQLEHLKAACECKLSADITVDSMFNLLMLADTYNASILKNKSIEFISSKASSMDILNVLFEKPQLSNQQSGTLINAMRELLRDKLSF